MVLAPYEGSGVTINASVGGLRVVDASVFPDVPNANTYGPVVMVAERAADLVLGNTPLAPEDRPSFPAPRRDGSPVPGLVEPVDA